MEDKLNIKGKLSFSTLFWVFWFLVWLFFNATSPPLAATEPQHTTSSCFASRISWNQHPFSIWSLVIALLTAALESQTQAVTNTIFALQKQIPRPTAPGKSLAKAGAPKPTGLRQQSLLLSREGRNFPNSKISWYNFTLAHSLAWAG